MRSLSQFTLIILLFVSAGCLWAPSQAASPDIHFDSGKSALRIPFELHNNQIYLQVSVNGSEPRWYVLDTGARTFISRAVAQRVGLKVQERGEFQSKEAMTFKYALSHGVSLKIPGANLPIDQVVVVDFDYLSKCLGRPADGILGQEFFKSAVVEIDYKNRLINAYEIKSYQYTGTGKSVSIEPLGNGQITIRAEVTTSNRPTFAGKFLVDTGFALSLSLNTHIVERHRLLAAGQNEEFTVCGFGESKAIKGKVASVQVDSFKFENATTLFSRAQRGDMAAEDIDGFIGGEILSQFKVIFDYSRKRMILEPYSQN
jgi:predicted aspartyl protease